VLGTPTPPPPADAGSIPADEKQFGGLSLRERLESHKRNPTCAACHNRIDPLGFPFERFDAVGRWREQYNDGKPIPDQLETLVTSLDEQGEQVRRNLAQKLLGYALGRTVLASDQLLLDRLAAAGPQARFSDLVAGVVASRQFRNRREEAAISAKVESK
jgi:hypothetical protein